MKQSKKKVIEPPKVIGIFSKEHKGDKVYFQKGIQELNRISKEYREILKEEQE